MSRPARSGRPSFRARIKSSLLDSLDVLRTHGRMLLFVFVILPNHIPSFAIFNTDHSIADMQRDFKRHTARQIIRPWLAENKTHMLGQLRDFNPDLRQNFKAGEDSYTGRNVFSACVISMNDVRDPLAYLA